MEKEKRTIRVKTTLAGKPVVLYYSLTAKQEAEMNRVVDELEVRGEEYDLADVIADILEDE